MWCRRVLLTGLQWLTGHPDSSLSRLLRMLLSQRWLIFTLGIDIGTFTHFLVCYSNMPWIAYYLFHSDNLFTPVDTVRGLVTGSSGRRYCISVTWRLPRVDGSMTSARWIWLVSLLRRRCSQLPRSGSGLGQFSSVLLHFRIPESQESLTESHGTLEA